MKLEVEVISKEIIKPSSSTPKNLHDYKLSFLDQIAPPVYNPLLLFYSSNATMSLEKSKHLKKTLSRVLTHFYPLAGRIKTESRVDCNDDGILYVTARVIECEVKSVIRNPPNPSELNKLLPFALDDITELPLGVQFNEFKCGGIAIGLCVSHKLTDALSVLTFVRSWAELSARGEPRTGIEFLSVNLFPPKNIQGFQTRTGITKENITSKRFGFSASKIEELKAKYTTPQQPKPPSRVEALSTLIWSRFATSTKLQPKIDRVYVINHAVNLRSRTEPQLPNHCFGNLYGVATTMNPPLDFMHGDGNGRKLVTQVRESISKIDKEYVKKLQTSNDHLESIKEKAQSFIDGEVVSFSFTSLCRFGFYETDFGWGKPGWVASACLSFKNLVVFMDSASGNEIEAWINLKEDDMSKFENDEEFISFIN